MGLMRTQTSHFDSSDSTTTPWWKLVIDQGPARVMEAAVNKPILPSAPKGPPFASGWEPVNVLEYEAFAHSVLPRSTFGFYGSGGNDMVTLRTNRAAYQRLRLRPRILRDVSTVTTATTLLGQQVSCPIGLAPCSMQRLAHPEGEAATARAAARHGVCMGLSSLSTVSLEKVAQAGGPQGLRWFQLYVFKDRQVTQRLVARAEGAGYRALVVTVDAPVLGRREADVRNRFALPDHMQLENFSDPAQGATMGQAEGNSGLAAYVASHVDASLQWSDLAWLRTITQMPIVVKGILTSEDATLAVQHGAAAVWVSNHGARQLDTTPSAVEVLPEVVKAVGPQVEVYVDGGVTRGTDVIKALALGARAVFLARPIFWSLSHNGEEGVYRMVQLLREEFELGLRLMGLTHVNQLEPSRQPQGQPLVVPASHYYHIDPEPETPRSRL